MIMFYLYFLIFLQGFFGLYGLILAIYYITHLETDPLTQRSRFIIFNQEQEKKLGEMILEAVSKRNKCSRNKEFKRN